MNPQYILDQLSVEFPDFEFSRNFAFENSGQLGDTFTITTSDGRKFSGEDFTAIQTEKDLQDVIANIRNNLL